MTRTVPAMASAGFHRRIQLYPYPDRIVAGLEDNLHFFAIELVHSDRTVTGIRMHAERYPWTSCADAPALLREHAVGKRLDELARMDMTRHCTHLFELAALCAAHAEDSAPVRYDLHVDDWVEKRSRVRLLVDDRPDLDLSVQGSIVETPGDWAGQDLFQLSQSQLLDAANREKAMLLARAIYVSLGRAAPPVERAVDRGPRILGICYSYQPGRVEGAWKMPHSRREFTDPSDQPLKDFDPLSEFR